MKKSKEVFVKNLLQHTDFSPGKIAILADVTEAFVQKIQKGKS